MKGRVKGKIVLVTGARGGIGKASSQLLADEGATVILSDHRKRPLSFKKSSLFHYLPLDVQCEEAWIAAMAWIKKKFGRLDVLVNNAGISGFQEGFGKQDPEHASLDSWRKVHAVNLDGVFLGCKHAIPLMKKRGGSIINISSRSGLIGIPFAAAYASSKAAVRNHTKSVALYCCQEGYSIRCNSIHPAAIATSMWDPILHDPHERKSQLEAIVSEIPMGRMGKPEEVAQAVLFLASDESSYITGSELMVDGGILAGKCENKVSVKCI